jgi:hypothetical protein
MDNMLFLPNGSQLSTLLQQLQVSLVVLLAALSQTALDAALE